MARKKKTDEDESQDNSDNINESDDNFGLPEIEYKPLDRDEQQDEYVEERNHSEEVASSHSNYDDEEIIEEKQTDHIFNPVEEESSSAGKVIGIIIILLIAAGAIWYFTVYRVNQKALADERARMEEQTRQNLAKDEAAKQAESQRIADEQRRADSIANAAPKIGTIETLNERTGRYYVVVASDIDDDLLMDYAKKLSVKGVSTQIIPEHGSVKFSRLTVASGETYGEAQSSADELKADYEGGAWVTKY